MEKYEASNGIEVHWDGAAGCDHYLSVDGDRIVLGLAAWQAMREFFRAERDEKVGRWRWPENPNYVVHPLAGQALVIDERTGRSHVFGRDDDSGVWALADAAEAYFEAHPERKPWHDAKPGEVWVLTLDGDEFAYTCSQPPSGHVYFGSEADTIELDSTMITAARRIWPEDAS